MVGGGEGSPYPNRGDAPVNEGSGREGGRVGEGE